MSMHSHSPASVDRTDDALLTVENLQTSFFTDKETIRAVDSISFEIDRGETVGIVGESGSGKSVTARSIMGLIDAPGRVVGGSVRFNDAETVERLARQYPDRTIDVDELRTEHDVADCIEQLLEQGVSPAKLTDGEQDRSDVDPVELAREDIVTMRDLVERRFTDELGITEKSAFVVRDTDGGYVDATHASEDAFRKLRGRGISMIFQDPLTSLNPVYTVGNQIKEAIRLHQGLQGTEAHEEAIRLLEAVSIPDAHRRVDEYPHEFSGGMRQRAVIAMALACKPELLICDEPTTALDVTIQAQILELLMEIQDDRDLAIMFITHDMGVIAEIADQVNVMYAGELVEKAPVGALFDAPKHPYTQGLLESIPGRHPEEDRLRTIEGDVPTPNEQPTYCRFAPRCPEAFDACEVVHPENVGVGDAEHTAACLLYPEELPTDEALEQHRSLGATDGGDQR
ncbi:oligopeptide/dipeptide ABC transporter ATP-binding protein [Halocatena pleomorpha]|uniref:Nickel import system ATP-binding protein NikD n=1 Tax=Halocatena pleomorpha TaxID=1785090 RepID=A0A3P3R711_9EURY|nr:oligopeptide/dipeptide ABC transporter ATP-binding protein [Halocatena pleomorpha]RRJ29145.1 ATP-binding cassette domain-containing protein [Halocatena pleomorpha]